MEYFLALTTSGIAVGVLYGMLGMAYAVIYKSTGVVNFAQGEVMMLTAYTAYAIASLWDVGFWTLLISVTIIAIFVGLFIEFVFIRPMLGQEVFSIVMVTIGLAVAIRAIVVMIWDADPIPFPSGLPGDVVSILGVGMYDSQIYSIFVFLALVFAMWIFLRFSRIGIAMRATANLQTTALLMGINVKRVFAIAWGLSAMISAVAGIFIASVQDLMPDMWFSGMKAFPAVIVGGLDSVFGAALGGIIIGLVENYAEGYIGFNLKEIAGFIVILIVLMIRPYGLFGKEEIERV
ncbi:MAG: branched-chain amino acid ABC transporter permease [Gammaproteobacteria bacterium]|nr:branched-chain amino acid ABC transporter permease [Gammaproteobacteria bacterium]